MDDWDDNSKEAGLEALDDAGRLMLSASSVSTYLRCGKQWEFAYVQKIKAPPTVRQALGIAAHEAFEENMLTKMVTQIDLPLEAVQAAFSDSYDRQVLDMEGVYDPDDPPARAKDQGIQLVSMQHRDIAPGIMPLLVEQPIQFEINGVIWTGTIDLVDGRYVLRDWKTSQRKPSSTASYLLAMTGYALGYRQASGQIESDVQLDFMVRYKKKEPAYYPVPSGGPVPDHAIHSFADTVGRVQAAIMSNIFLPNGPQSFACSWCGYGAAGLCPYYDPR
jgi:RecB family exonuclease